jgi:uncharacterized damage-inducible protein DinB
VKEVDRVEDEVRRASSGDPWHGCAIKEILTGVDARAAAGKPLAGAHSIWEIVLHITAWTREVARRIKGAAPQQPIEGDWPAVAVTSPEAWETARLELHKAHELLVAALRDFPESRLDECVGEVRNAPLGTGVSYYQTLHGLVQHDAYHAGQIALLKKAQSHTAEAQSR